MSAGMNFFMGIFYLGLAGAFAALGIRFLIMSVIATTLVK
jgi:hypothetical protein